MLSRAYIEALLVDSEAADAVWIAWNGGELSDLVAALAWVHIADVLSTDDSDSDD